MTLGMALTACANVVSAPKWKRATRAGCVNIQPGRGPCRCSLQVPPRHFLLTLNNDCMQYVYPYSKILLFMSTLIIPSMGGRYFTKQGGNFLRLQGGVQIEALINAAQKVIGGDVIFRLNE